MKQFYKMTRILLVLTISLVFACGNDDDGNTEPQANYAELIIGTWTWTSQTTNGVDLGPLSECELMETFIYDGTQVEQIDYSGNPCTQAFTSTENYSIEGNMITYSALDDPSDAYTEEIIELNATTLKIRYEEEFGGETFIVVDTYTRVE